METIEKKIRLTQYSHGAGCGCKISPEVLDDILEKAGTSTARFDSLLVGNSDRDDAAVMDLGDGTAIISTTDFFMPIVDDPETFGKIAATNAISDIYAMGGTPMMAIAILGWPVNVLSAEVAGMVIRGAWIVCQEAGIPLAGGHSIDAPEPIFGLAVTGRVDLANIKKNGGASPGDILYLTKPLGIGVLSTAQKKGMLTSAHEELSVKWMTQLNTVGEELGKMEGVTAMTDITGFGLAGHLIEMCRASNTSAQMDFDNLPVIDKAVFEYISQGCVPGGTNRNYDSYGKEMSLRNPENKSLICDPQTSGGLLIAVRKEADLEVRNLLISENLWSQPIGKMVAKGEYLVEVI